MAYSLGIVFSLASVVLGTAHATKNPLARALSALIEDNVFGEIMKLDNFVNIGDEDTCQDEMGELSPPCPFRIFCSQVMLLFKWKYTVTSRF